MAIFWVTCCDHNRSNGRNLKFHFSCRANSISELESILRRDKVISGLKIETKHRPDGGRDISAGREMLLGVAGILMVQDALPFDAPREA